MGITSFTVIAALIVRPSSIYPHTIDMPVPSNFFLHPQATTVTVENARTDTALQLAIGFYFANRNTTTTVLYPRKNRSPSRIKKTGVSIRRVAAMHKILFSQLQRAITTGGQLQTRTKALEAEMVLTIAEEAALEEWRLVMYRWGSPIRLDMLKCMEIGRAHV